MYQKILKKTIKATCGAALDFLFPASEMVKTFEDTSASNLLRLLPASEPSGEFSALFAYCDERVKNLVWEIKYYRNQKVTETVGALMAEKIQKMFTGKSSAHFLVPIPLTAKRLRERGYNHTELLAQSILKNLPENFVLAADVLKKIRHTPKQHSLENRDDRFINIAGAFEVPAAMIASVKNQRVIIIDDVVTTGATVNDATRALFSAGAQSVTVYAVAH